MKEKKKTGSLSALGEFPWTRTRGIPRYWDGKFKGVVELDLFAVCYLKAVETFRYTNSLNANVRFPRLIRGLNRTTEVR